VIVLDASVLIARLDQRDDHHDRASRLLADTGAEPLGASTITLAETLVAPAGAGRVEDAVAALDRLGVTELSLGNEAPAASVPKSGTSCLIVEYCWQPRSTLAWSPASIRHPSTQRMAWVFLSTDSPDPAENGP
jgi:hypothetical protein